MPTVAGNLLKLCGAFVVVGLAGCLQPCWRNECDWRHVYQQGLLPPALETRPEEVIQPEVPSIPDPATVLAPDRPPYYLSLAEAFAMALEKGTVGGQSVRSPGAAIDDLVSFSGSGVSGNDAIRVLAYQPARLGTNIEAALARFDPFWSTTMSWSTTDEPTQGLSDLSNGMSANFTSTLAKPLATGGAAGVKFSTDYTLYSNPPRGQFAVLNPSYQPKLLFGFEQPLLRFYGVDINQMLSSIPSSNLFSALGSSARPASSFQGILIARLRFDQARAELERTVNYMLLNVEAAYWNLYGAYVGLYVVEQGLRQAHMSWMIGKKQLEGGKIDISQLAQIRGQYEQFRGDRITALGNVLSNERTLRQLVGLPVEDGRRLVPVNAPTTAPTRPDWQDALTSALNLRPELILARQDVQAKQWNLLVQKNFLLPDLRFQSSYTLVGLGTRLDGNDDYRTPGGQLQPLNAFRSLTSAHYNDWTVGLTLNMPIGFRYEHAQTRDARLQLAQSFTLLKNQEQKAITFLAKQYSIVVEKYNAIQVRRQQRLAQAEQVSARFRKYAAGVKDSPLEFLLAAQTQWTFALSLEYQAIVDYNIALANFEFAKGTLMRYDHVHIAEGALPECASVRAVDHERQRTMQIASHELDRSQRLHVPGQSPMPQWPEHDAPSVLEIHHDTVNGLPPAEEELPAPQTVPNAAPEPPAEEQLPAPRAIPLAPPAASLEEQMPVVPLPPAAPPRAEQMLAPRAVPLAPAPPRVEAPMPAPRAVPLAPVAPRVDELLPAPRVMPLAPPPLSPAAGPTVEPPIRARLGTPE